jgi:hypothetical protein
MLKNARLSHRQLLIAFQQAEGNFFMVIEDSILADPIQGGHGIESPE